MQVGNSTAASVVAQLAQATQANRAENIRQIQTLNANVEDNKQAAIEFSVQQQSEGARVKGSIIDVMA